MRNSTTVPTGCIRTPPGAVAAPSTTHRITAHTTTHTALRGVPRERAMLAR